MGKAEKIAFLSPRFSENATVGGAETLLKNLALEAASVGRKVTVLTTCATDHFSWKNEREAGRISFGDIDVEFFPVDEDRDLDTFMRLDQSIGRKHTLSREEEELWLKTSVNSKAMCDHIRNNSDDYDRIVMGPYLFGLIHHAAQILPEKTVLAPCLHDEAFAYLSVMQDLFNSVDSFMFNSEPERDLACRLYNLNPSSLNVVGMVMDDFESDPKAFAKSQKSDIPYVIYCGRREPLKGTPLFLDYMSAFRSRTKRDVKVVMTGSGKVDIPSDLVRHVIDLGFVSEEDKHNAMAGAVAFCHPSTNESFGIVILESWLAGRPVLVHAGGTVLKYHCQKSGGGLWFSNYPEFEAELELLLDNKTLASEMGKTGRAYVKNEYSRESITKKMLAALDG